MDMDQENRNNSQTTKDKLPNNLKRLIESLSAHVPPLLANSHEVTKIASINGQIPLPAIAANEISGISDSSHDSSINSIGYVADTSELNQPDNGSPAKIPPTSQVAPLTPTTNLKMLVAAASSALDRERENEEAKKTLFNENEDSSTSRKLKSLALLCKKFLQVADEEIGAGKEFSLEMMASSLGINRRRIYDIINVMEALEMISKQSKNWYLWHGRGNLLHTLAKLKAMVTDDPDIKPYLENPGSDKTKEMSVKTEVTIPKDEAEPTNEPMCSEVIDDEESDQNCYDPVDYPFATRSVRYDKSLGVLCQKFVMLFLISQDHEVTLEEAGRILVPDYQDDTIYMALNPPVNPKTKVRRLYDIANILTSLGLIKKKVFVGPLHIKKPGYSWSGPTIEEIESAWNNKKQESKPVLNKVKKSASSRPFLHHYDLQKETSPFCSPVKVLGGTRFKKSLSFGGTTTSTPRPMKTSSTPPISRHSTVLARPLCPKQVDYLREMREFESEMNKHAHRYPHVASVFHEFLQKYQSTLEQTAAANGRFILPKAISSVSHSSVSIPSAQQDIGHQQLLQKPVVHSDTHPCNCGAWEGCVMKDNDSHSQIGHTHIVNGQGSTMGQLIQTTDMMAAGSMMCDAVACGMPNNTFVANLANSILANILGTIQNSATTDLPSTQAHEEVEPTQTTIGQKSDVSTALPLMEIQNLQEKPTMLPIGSLPNPKEGFVHVDDLLVKPGSRVKPGNSTLLFNSLVNQKPFSTSLESQNCPVVVNIAPTSATAVNPNAFLTSHDLGVDKENLPTTIKCDTGYHGIERSPKRQRMN